MSFVRKKIINPARDYLKTIKLFSRNIRLYLFGVFLAGLTFSAYMLLLNLYLREQGSSESFIGAVLSAGAVGMALTSIPAALLLRRIRLKPILQWTITLYSLSIILLTWLPVGNLLVIVSFAGGVTMTFYRVAGAPFFMRNTTTRERTYVFSSGFGVSLFASMLGSLVFGWLVPQLEIYTGDIVQAYRWTFAISVALGLLALIPFSLIKAVDPTEDNDKAIFSFGVVRRRLSLYSRLFIPYLIVGGGAGLIIPFLNLYFRDRFDQPPDKIGFFFFVVHTTMLIGIMAGPVLARKMGLVRTMVWTQLLSIPFMILLAYTYYLPLAVFAFLMRGALMNLGQPIGSNFAMEMVTKSEHALVNALLMLAWTGSWMISTAIGGRLIEYYGYTLPLMAAVVLYIVSSLLYYLFFRKSERKNVSGFEVIAPELKA
jgi:MFS family permease